MSIEFLKGFAAGTLSDEQLQKGCDEGWLINDEFEKDCISQACYELRASNIYYELDCVDLGTRPPRFELPEESSILLKPKQIVTIITQESLRLPNNILGRVLTKGSLFSIGIVPVNTYADPGFEGQLGIVMANLSFNYIRIHRGQPIAKIEFSKLRTPVVRSYTGQHGYQTKMWPIPHEMVVSREQLEREGDQRVLSIHDELSLTHGPIVGKVAQRIFYTERWLILATIMYLTFSIALIVFLIAKSDGVSVSLIATVAIGVVSNAIFWVLTNFATNLRK